MFFNVNYKVKPIISIQELIIDLIKKNNIIVNTTNKFEIEEYSKKKRKRDSI